MDCSPTPIKSSWKIHCEKQEMRKHLIGYQKLPLSLELSSEDEHPSVRPNHAETHCDASESAAKKRKILNVEDLLPQVLNDMEEEIERQLDSKAEKTNLTVINVKNIIKSVITNEDVMAMVRQSLHDQTEGLDVKCIYEPKLTRAKTKELLKLQPMSSNLWPITPVKNSPSKSECQVLIQQELPEDSSDEEYNPNEDYQSDEDDDKNNSSVTSDVDSSPATPVSSTANVSLDESTTVWSEDGMFKVPPENIGQRTRSKLCLSDTPLEAIEQAFIPPDITTDMYEWGCDNDDWKNFLQEFSKPLDSERPVVDDPEEDPEYNVLADEEEEIVDKEELRMDRAVKVSRKELNELMAELFEYTENVMHRTSDDEEEPLKSEKLETVNRTIFDGFYLQYPTPCSTSILDQSGIYQQSSSLPVQSSNLSCDIVESSCFPQSNSIAPLRSSSQTDVTAASQTSLNSDSHQKENCMMSENKVQPIESNASQSLSTPNRTSAPPTPNQVLFTPTPNKVPCTPNNKTSSCRNAFSPLDLNELCNSSEAFLSIDKDKTPLKVGQVNIEVNKQQGKQVESLNKTTDVANKVEELLCKEQILLLNQQMRQHVQLTTQHFLQCYRHPELSYIADQCKNILIDIEKQSKESKLRNSVFNPLNLKSAMKVVKAWESLFDVPSVETSIKSFVEKMYTKYVGKNRKLYKGTVPCDLLFPPALLEIVSASKAFIYPLLLPPVPFFKRGFKLTRQVYFQSEERLIVYGIHTYSEVVKENPSKFSEKEREWDVLPLIIKNLVPTGDEVSLKNLILRRRYSRENSAIKEYYKSNKLPHLVHYVIPVEESRTLLQQPTDLLPTLWKNFVELKLRRAAKKAS